MELDEFVKKFAEQFDDTPLDAFSPNTIYKDLDEWGSLTSLSVISMVDDELGKRITGADLRSCTTIEDLYKLVLAR